MEGKMRFPIRAIIFGATMGLTSGASVADETIVFIRHGEKPCAGLGQLAPEGLTRALALPKALADRFYPNESDRKPSAIFAPNPSKRKTDEGKDYDYVRPLATIEPTAIALGKPVNTEIGFDDTNGLITALTDPANRDALVLVAWEHKYINGVECNLLTGDDCNFQADASGHKKSGDVLKWGKNEFDRIDVVNITWSGEAKQATLQPSEKEGLDRESVACPESGVGGGSGD
jgi:hypothetical protein